MEINIHIEELRKRVIRSIISILVITVFILTFHATPFDVMGITLYYPYPEPLNNIAAQFTNVMKGELVPEGVQLIQTAPGQAFFSQVYIAALIGIVLSIPIIVREFISFLKPALKDREINVGRSITLPAIGLFITGCAFSYAAVIPFILDFLYQIWRICRISYIFEYHGLCNICFTILIGIWNIISITTHNVCS